LRSKIINMAERMKDREDIALEALFSSAPIADEGFTRGVVARVRRRIWIRRLALPVAALVGIAIAAKPAVELFDSLGAIAAVLPPDLLRFPAVHFELGSGMLTGAVTVAVATIAALFVLPILDD